MMHAGRRVITAGLLMVCLGASTAAAQERFRYDDKQARDPLEPLVTPDGRILPGARGAVADVSDVVIEGIIWDTADRSVAIINGTLVRELDMVQGYQVLKIRKESVILQRGGKVIVVGLQQKGGE